MTWNLKQKTQQILAREKGTIYKPHGKLRVALAFPNFYRLGMSNLGFQTVYRLFNNLPDVSCERVFLPEPEHAAEYRRTGTRLFSLESQTPLRDFDVVAFSITYEMDSVQVLKILDLAGISLTGEDRSDEEPLVIAGGPVATINPEPLAQFVDAFVVGEAEDLLGELSQTMIETLRLPRKERIRSLSKVESVYVPSLYEVNYHADGRVSEILAKENAPLPVRKRVVRDLNRYDAVSTVLTPDTEFGGILLTEVARGCKRGCRFCVAGHAYRPVRFRDTGAVSRAAAAAEGISLRIGLVGSSVSDNPQVKEICRELLSQGWQITASSLRAESLGAELAQELAQGGQLTVTIAPEAGTERMRGVIHKPTPESEFFRVVHDLVQAGIRKIKLYYMLGLPTERDEDAEAIADLSLRLWKDSGLQKMTVAVTPFVPKPFTPFQWHPTEDRKVLERRIERIRSSLRRIRNVEFSFESPRESQVQAVLARGDRRISEAILACYRNDGNWTKAFREANTDMGFYAYRQRERDEVFPWEVVDLKLNSNQLWREYRTALEKCGVPVDE